MIRRFVILASKEVLEHLWVVAASGLVLSLLGVSGWLSARSDPLATSPLHGVAGVLLFFVPLLGLVLGHRMVVREYQGHTQLFLEALPLRRWEMVFAKYAVGLLAISLLVLAYVLGTALALSETAPRYLAILALRSVGFVMPVWTLFFSFGMLGRLRLAAYLTLAFGLMLVESTTAFEFERFGPVALIDPDTFPYERALVPYRAFAESLATSLALLGVGLAIALVREGSFAERLSRRASAREAAVIGVLLVAEASGALWLQSKQKLEPFAFTSDTVVQSAAGTEIMYAWPALEPRARLVAAAIDELGGKTARELGVEQRAPIRIAHNPVLMRREIKNQSSPNTDGVLLEVNLGADDFDLRQLTEHALHAAFMRLSEGRAGFEPNHWLLDGFSTWYASEPSPEASEVHYRRALVAMGRVEISHEAVTHWERLMDAAGETGAESLAFTLVDFLSQRHGRRAVLAMGRDVLARPSVTGLTSWLAERRATLAARVAALTGEPWPATIAAWRKTLARRGAQGDFAEPLARLLADRAAIRIEQSAIGADVVYSLMGPPRSADQTCVVLHEKLRPFDEYVSPQRAERRVLVWRAGQERFEGRLRGSYQRGDRAWIAVECEAAELRSETRLVSARIEVK